jgi:hypothetical protein
MIMKNIFSFLLVLIISSHSWAQCSVSLGNDIVQCNGAPVTLVPVFNGTATPQQLRIQYNATMGVSGLVNAPKVYMHSGIQTVPFGGWEYVVGNWGQDDGLGEMTEISNDLWEITINVPSYYNYPGGTNVNGLWLVFRNADGSATGKNDNDEDIFLYTSNGNTCDFGGVTGTDIAPNAGSFSWNTGATSQNLTINESGTYTVTYTDGVGCSTSDAVLVTFSTSSIQVDLGPDQSLCDGETIVLNAGAGYSSYVWSTSETSQTLEVGLPGDYSVTVTDANGCTGIDLVHIETGTSPMADFSHSPVSGLTVEFTDIGSDAETVYWDFDANGTTDATSTAGGTVQHTFPSESVFGVRMISENACGSDTATHNVLVQDVAVEELAASVGLQVYPNPVADVLSVAVNSTCQLLGIELVDVAGRSVVRTGQLQGNAATIDLASSVNGTYILSVITDEGTIRRTIIRQTP